MSRSKKDDGKKENVDKKVDDKKADEKTAPADNVRMCILYVYYVIYKCVIYLIYTYCAFDHRHIMYACEKRELRQER